MKRIYVAGPFSGLEMQNTRRAILAAKDLRDSGYCPYVPHLTAFVDLLTPVPYEDVMKECFAWIEVCDGVLFIGPSPGANREIKFAQEHNVPVFESIQDLNHYFLHN